MENSTFISICFQRVVKKGINNIIIYNIYTSAKSIIFEMAKMYIRLSFFDENGDKTHRAPS